MRKTPATDSARLVVMSQQPPNTTEQTEEEPRRPYTPWHYMVAAIFEFLLKPRGYQVEAFVKVGYLWRL